MGRKTEQICNVRAEIGTQGTMGSEKCTIMHSARETQMIADIAKVSHVRPAE